MERRLLFLEHGSTRPTLSVPHLLAGDSSAYYHGYVLALMAVHQTREFFLERDGHLCDNPRIGPDLARRYWQPGNAESFATLVSSLTGRPLSGEPLAESVNRTADAAVAEARERIATLQRVPFHQSRIDLGARIAIVHGHDRIATTEEGGFEACAERFAAWIDARTAEASRAR